MPGIEYTCDDATVPDTVKTYDIDVALTNAVIVWFPLPNNHVVGRFVPDICTG